MAAVRTTLVYACGLSAALGLAFSGHGLYLYAKAGLAQWLLDAAWSQAMAGRTEAKPWPWADSHALARLWLPGGRPLVVLSSDAGSSLAFAPGHMRTSALPGAPGHSVISAHRDTHFRALQYLRRGQRITVQRRDGARVVYTIQSREIMHVERQRLRRRDGDGFWLTLVTCYPFDAVRPGGPWRFLVHARAKGPTPNAGGGENRAN